MGYEAAYYWRTTLTLSQREAEWMASEGIGRVYLRLFDVVMHDGTAQPNATLQFPADTMAMDSPRDVPGVYSVLPDSTEVVPTVFIMNDVMRSASTRPDSLAQRVGRRIVQMSRTRRFAFSEVQMDCDWTQSTREAYFDFLRHLRQALPEGVRLSATIRLHQLSQPAPPVDCGVLMVYNTGNYRDATTDHNPILDLRDVQPYMRHLRSYSLPLTAAYPNFGWQLLFAGQDFQGILYGVDLSDATTFRPLPPSTKKTGGSAAPDRYEVVAARSIVMSMGGSTLHLLPGQTVCVWRVHPDDLAAVRHLIARTRPGINDHAIVYLIEEDNLE